MWKLWFWKLHNVKPCDSIVTNLAANFCLQSAKTNIKIKDTVMHSKRLLQNHPLRVLSVFKDGKNKKILENFTCQLFIIL